MKKMMMAWVAAGAIGLVGCGGSEQAEPGPAEFKADYKTSGDFFTRMQAPVKGSSPHGTVRIYYSSNVKELVTTSAFTVPEGTVSIKEVYDEGTGAVKAYAVMVKKAAGYDIANNDWYYEMRDAQGAVMADPPAGKTAMCISCHAAAKQTDYLAGTSL